MKGSIYEIMSELFKDAQKSKSCHKEYFESLKNLYKESDFDEFFDSFLLCIKITLAHDEMNEQVQNALEFSAEFAARLSPPAPLHEAKMCPLLEKIFNFIFDNHGAIDTGVRSRICCFLSLLMRIMSECSEEVWINNDIWEKILTTMTQRLIDKSPEVRIEAVRALYNLQDTNDNNCPVINKYITHLSSDLNPNVRKEIINNIARTNKAIDAVIERTIDNDETVRECAYLYLCKLSEIDKKSLSKKNQKILIKRGYNDTTIVRNVVCQKLILSWLNAYNNDIYDYLNSFDCIDDNDNTIDIVLTSLLNQQPINTILKQLPIDLDTILIPIDDIKCEYIIYWRYLIKHLNNLKYYDLLELILPNLRDFCEYIYNIQYKMINNNNNNDNNNYYSDNKICEYILYQLIEIIKMYDYTNDYDKTLIKLLFEKTLKFELCDVKLIKLIVEHYEYIIPDVDIRINILSDIINDMKTIDHINDYNNVKNISKITIKCLEIMCTMTQASTVKNVNNVIKELFTNLALPYCIKNTNQNIQILALKAVGICLLLDGQLAKKYMSMFVTVFHTYKNNRVIWKIILTVIFDLFLSYGLDHFDYIHKKGIFNQKHTTGVNIVNMLMESINHPDQEIRTSIIIGFCKLLLHNIITSIPLVSRLLIFLHDPSTIKNPLLHQVLTVFFKQYPIETPGSQLLLQNIYFPTLRLLFDAPINSSLKKIQPHTVTNFILTLTNVNYLNNDKKDYTIHNNLAWSILNHALNSNKNYNRNELIKSLDNIQIGNVDEKIINDMLKKIDEIIDDMPLNDYEFIKILANFKDKLLVEKSNNNQDIQSTS